MTEMMDKVERKHETEDRSAASKFSKWKASVAALSVAGLVAAGPLSCDNNSPSSYTDGGYSDGTEEAVDSWASGMDSGTQEDAVESECSAPPLQCTSSETFSDVLLGTDQVLGDVLVLGDVRIRLDATGEANGNQFARFDLIDSCGNILDTKTIPNGSSDTLNSHGISISVSVSQVTVLSPTTARITATMNCPDAGMEAEAGDDSTVKAGDDSSSDDAGADTD